MKKISFWYTIFLVLCHGLISHGQISLSRETGVQPSFAAESEETPTPHPAEEFTESVEKAPAPPVAKAPHNKSQPKGEWYKNYWIWGLLAFLAVVLAVIDRSLNLWGKLVNCWQKKQIQEEREISKKLPGTPIIKRELPKFIQSRFPDIISNEIIVGFLDDSKSLRSHKHKYKEVTFKRTFFERIFMTFSGTIINSLAHKLAESFKDIENEVDFIFYDNKEANKDFLSPFWEKLQRGINTITSDQLEEVEISEGSGIIIIETKLLLEDDLIEYIKKLKSKKINILGCAILFCEKGSELSKLKELTDNGRIHIGVTVDLGRQP